MRTRNIFKTLAMTSLMFLSTGCSDWLAVDMEDGIMEDKLFETNEGYVATLNGVYSKMNAIYGSNLSMGVIDVMAQYYNVAQNSGHQFKAFAEYDFEQANFESTSGNIWTTQYNLIANLNTLLEHCGEGGNGVLKNHYFPYVKGEALALRAMLHFDLLRLYGPIYNDESASTLVMPYQETSSKEIQPLLPASEVMEKIIRDLNEAAELLKEDKIRKEGIMDSESEDPNENSDFRYRQYRLNYYAVQGLLVRAYAWMQNKDKAYELATNLIKENEEKKTFEWIKKDQVQSSSPNRIFSTEVMFALYNQKRNNLYDNLFNPSTGMNNCLSFAGETLEEGDEDGKINYFYQDMDDLRRGSNMWTVEDVEQSDEYGGGSVTSEKTICFHKFEGVPSVSDSWKFMIPLLRMTEIYLTAAEYAKTPEEAIKYINEVRKHRNCVNIEYKGDETPDKIQGYITAEFSREVIGEGQLYFYYKRHAMTTIMSGTDFGMWYDGTYTMELQNYVWPLPKVEIDKRGTSNK